MNIWRKSSYSHGGCCVEVNAPFRTSSYSGSTGCVEVARMRKSSYSNPDGNCLEVMHGATSAVIRDSKNPSGPTAVHLVVPGPSWNAFLGGIRAGDFHD